MTDRVTEVRQVGKEEDVNRLLKDGWDLFNAIPGGTGFALFILVRRDEPLTRYGGATVP
jgi:hypothetical protein